MKIYHGIVTLRPTSHNPASESWDCRTAGTPTAFTGDSTSGTRSDCLPLFPWCLPFPRTPVPESPIFPCTENCAGRIEYPPVAVFNIELSWQNQVCLTQLIAAQSTILQDEGQASPGFVAHCLFVIVRASHDAVAQWRRSLFWKENASYGHCNSGTFRGETC